MVTTKNIPKAMDATIDFVVGRAIDCILGGNLYF